MQFILHILLWSAFFLHSIYSEPPTWMYIFAYSWTPEFCYGHNYTGCSSPQDYWKTHFTIHGLWPQYVAGGYPSYCTNETFNSTIIESSIGMETLEEYWPNVQEDPKSANYTSFWSHEWSKHGTCTGLSQYDYFNSAINLIKSFGTPSSLVSAVGETISAIILRTDLGGNTSVALQCDSCKYLSGAYTCWSQMDGIPQNITVCPPDVIGEDTCLDEVLYVTSFST